MSSKRLNWSTNPKYCVHGHYLNDKTIGTDRNYPYCKTCKAKSTKRYIRRFKMQFTEEEIELIKKLIEDWGFKYCLKADFEDVKKLAEKLGLKQFRNF